MIFNRVEIQNEFNYLKHTNVHPVSIFNSLNKNILTYYFCLIFNRNQNIFIFILNSKLFHFRHLLLILDKPMS